MSTEKKLFQESGKQQGQEESNHTFNRPKVELTQLPFIEYDDSWDSPVETHNIAEFYNKKVVCWKLKPGLSKAEKKKYRASLHQHYLTENDDKPTEKKKQ